MRYSTRSRRLAAVLGGLACIAMLSALETDARAEDEDPFVFVYTSDPMDFALLVDRVGDAPVLERLAEPAEDAPRPVAVRLAAVRASAWLRAPEAALGTLATLAAGRDPDLAPAAMLALVRISETLSRADLDAREADDAAVQAALEPLASLANDATARADLRQAAARVRIMLAALVEPAPS